MASHRFTLAALISLPLLLPNPATAQLNVTVVGALGDLDANGDGGAGEAAVLQTVVNCWAARIGTNRNFTLNVFTANLTGGTIGQGAVSAVDAGGVPTAGRITMDTPRNYFVDPTPLASAEFTPDPQSRWRFIGGPAQTDLYSVVNHEVGHALAWLCGDSCGFDNPNYDALMNPAPGSFVANANCTAPFPLAGQPFLPGCVHLQAGGAHPFDAPLRGDGLGGSGSSVVNELSHPGISGELMLGFYNSGARELQSDISVDVLRHAYGDAVNLPPTVDAGADILSECSAVGGSNVPLAGTGSSDPEGNPLSFAWGCPGITLAAANTATPNGFFPVNTTVTCRLDATDLAVCPSSANTVDVRVVDTTAPDIDCPGAIVVECSETGGAPASHPAIATFLGGATASDICDPTLNVSDNAPPFFDVGATTNVTFSTLDDSGNPASCFSGVSVVDTVAPVITGLTATPSLLWPPNHKLTPVSVAVEVSDVCDTAASCHIASIVSNQPLNALGDGNTAADWQITGPLTANLRAERAGNDREDRIYSLTVSCSDDFANGVSKSVEVRVPHDRR